MKFSTELNDISYIIETIDGQQTDAKYHMHLNREQRDQLKTGERKYFSIRISASAYNKDLEFIIQGVPLSFDQEVMLEDIEDFFENQCIFSKVEHHFQLESRQSSKTIWGENHE